MLYRISWLKYTNKQLNKSMHFGIFKTFFVEIYMVDYVKRFHKDIDCHGGQTSYCLMDNSLQPSRGFLMVRKILLTAKDIITLELRETMILNHEKKLILFLSYENVLLLWKGYMGKLPRSIWIKHLHEMLAMFCKYCDE